MRASGRGSAREQLIKHALETCKHFNGTQHDTCRAGVSYAELCGQEPGWGLRLPCIQWEDSTEAQRRQELGLTLATCDRLVLPSQAEAEAEADAGLAARQRFIEQLAAGICPACGKATEPRRQVGHCIYGACGHRLGQGRLK